MKIVKYFLVGGVAAVVDIGLFSFLTKYAQFHWFPVSIVSFSIATLLNYYLSIAHIFQSGSRFQKNHEIMLVFIISGLALMTNQLFLFVLIEKNNINLIAAKIVSTGLVFFINYFGRKKLIFSNT